MYEIRVLCAACGDVNSGGGCVVVGGGWCWLVLIGGGWWRLVVVGGGGWLVVGGVVVWR
jgi:hypothetical protein